MSYPENYRYAKSHEWVSVEGENATVGITDYAQDSLGDIVFVELPKVGQNVEAGSTFGSVESVKAVSDLGRLYKDWSIYRAEAMAKRAQAFADKIKSAGNLRGSEVEKMMSEWAQEQIELLAKSAKELTADGDKGNYGHEIFAGKNA